MKKLGFVLLVVKLAIILLISHSSSCSFVKGDDINWSTLTSNQLYNLSPNVFSTITSEQLSQIPANSCSGFTAEQITKLNPSACSGFSSGQLNSLKVAYPTQISSAFTANCFVNILPASLNSVSADFVANIAGTVFNSMTSQQVQALPGAAFTKVSSTLLQSITSPTVCSSLTANQVSNLDSSYPRQSCSGFVGACISNMNATAFTGINLACVKVLSESALKYITADQLNQIPAASFAGFTSDNLKYLSQSCGGFTSSQMATLNNAYPSYACAGFIGNCISNIPANAFTGMSNACAKQLGQSALMSFTNDQVSQIPAASFSGFSGDNLKYLSISGCGGITADQIEKLDNSYPSYACSGFTANCLGAVPANSFTKMTSTCVAQLGKEAVRGLVQDQMNQFAPASFSGFASGNIAGLSDSACKGIKDSQMSNLNNKYPNYACSGISPSCTSNIPSDAFSLILPDCIANLPLASTKQITSAQLSKISPKSISGFSSDNIKGLKDSCVGFSDVQVANLDTTYPKYACQGINSDCVTAIQANSFSGFTGNCISQIPADSISVISKDQLSQVSLNGISGLTSDQLATFLSETCSGFTAQQIGGLTTNYPKYACQGFRFKCLNGLSLNVIPSFTSNCFGQIPSNAVSGFSPKAIPLFSSKSLVGLTTAQLETFYSYFGLNQFVDVLSQKQIEGVTVNTILGFKLDLEKNLFYRNRELQSYELDSLSWLQLSVSTEESTKRVLSGSLSNVIPKTFNGLLNNSQLFESDFYAKLSEDQLNNVLYDTISSITLDQIELVSDTVFISPNSFFKYFKYINTNAIKGVTKSQFTKLVSNTNYGLDYLMTCDQFNALTQEQYNFLSTFDSYSRIYDKCTTPNPPNPPPNPGSSTPPPVPPKPNRSTQPVPPNPHQSNKRNNSASNMSMEIIMMFAMMVMILIQ